MKKNICLLVLSILLISLINNNLTYAFSNEEVQNNKEVQKIVYLTFDDGPDYKNTPKVLDILQKEDVKATFFVISSEFLERENVIKRIYDEGHALGLHSHTHSKSKLYSCSENFLDEMLTCQDKIYEITGYKPNIIRFPFGCNNGSYKLKQSLVDLLHDNNLKIFDWNVDSGDGANHNLSPHLIEKKATTIKCDGPVILLMHSSMINKNSVEALPSIIKYYKDNNYEFKVIDETTKERYKILKN